MIGETKMRGTNSNLLKALTLSVLVASFALLLTHPARAFRPTAVEFQNFGTVGITRGQTARLNVVNFGREPIALSLNFTDSEGRLIHHSVETVEGGHATFLDVAYPVGDAIIPGRLGVHAWVEVGGGGGAGRQVGEILSTLEVFDNDTGRTSFALAACDGSVRI